MLGECVQSAGIQNIESQHINISDLQPGVYFVRVGNESKMFVKE
jgi:hypothetical protein